MKRSQSYSIILDPYAITSQIGFTDYGKTYMPQTAVHVSNRVVKCCWICELFT